MSKRPKRGDYQPPGGLPIPRQPDPTRRTPDPVPYVPMPKQTVASWWPLVAGFSIVFVLVLVIIGLAIARGGDAPIPPRVTPTSAPP